MSVNGSGQGVALMLAELENTGTALKEEQFLLIIQIQYRHKCLQQSLVISNVPSLITCGQEGDKRPQP